MKKKQILSGIVLAICLILYHLLVILIPFAKNAIFWLSYAFTLAAFFVAAASIYIAFIHTPDIKSRFYNFPIARLGVIYIAVQLAGGLVFMSLSAFIKAWVAALVYSFALGAAVIGLISVETVLEEIHVQDAKLKKNVAMMRSLQSRVNQLAGLSGEASIKALADEFRYCDPVSSDALAEIEQDLAAVVDDLQAAVAKGDPEGVEKLCRRASAVLAERNRLCKLNKA